MFVIQFLIKNNNEVNIAPLAAEGAMCSFHTFEKTRFKICSLLRNQICNINVWC